MRISGNNAGYTTIRGSVKSTGYPRHSPVSPSLPLPCIIVRHHVSTGLYKHSYRTGGQGSTFLRNAGTTLPTPWRGDNFEKLPASLLVKKLPAFCGTRKYFYCVHNRQPLFAVLSKINPLHALPPYLRSILIIYSHLRVLQGVQGLLPGVKAAVAWR